MKKYILAISAFALALSCQKEASVEDELILGEGIPVTVVIGGPEYGGEDEEVKITQSLSEDGKKYNYKWEAGDAFRLVAYEPIEETGETTIMDCGDFVTAAGGEQATFSGTIPAEMPGTYTEYWAVAPAPKEGDKFSIAEKSTATSSFRYLMTMDIAETQDGTGFKYAHFCAISTSKSQLAKDTESGTWTFTGSPVFKMSEAMLHFCLEEGHGITKIEVSYELYDATSKAAKKTAIAGETYYATNSTGTNSSKTSTTPSPILTIYDDGKVLPQNIYFAVRHQAAGADGSRMHFKFSKADGSYVVKKLSLKQKTTTDDGKTTTTNSSLSGGCVYNLGTLDTRGWSFRPSKLEIAWKAGDGFRAPSGKSYTEFPTAFLNSEKASGATSSTYHLYATLDENGKVIDEYKYVDKNTKFDTGIGSGAGVYIENNFLGRNYLFEQREYESGEYESGKYKFSFGKYYAFVPEDKSSTQAGWFRLVLSYFSAPAIPGYKLVKTRIVNNTTAYDKSDYSNKNPAFSIVKTRPGDTGTGGTDYLSGAGSTRSSYVVKDEGTLCSTREQIREAIESGKSFETYAVSELSPTNAEADTEYFVQTGSVANIGEFVFTYENVEPFPNITAK